jgi:hypothetical protein
MMKLLNLFTLLILVACASQKKKSSYEFDKEKDIDVPTWVYSADEACDENLYLCTSASAENQNLADTRAKKSLAAVFETKIKSSFDVYKTSFSQEERESVEEEINSEVNESVVGILKTVQITERFKKNDIFFSLARLDRKKSAQGLKSQIKKIDDELKYLYSKKMRGSIKKMMILNEKRTRLVDKYIVLEGNKLPSPVSFAQIQNIKFQSEYGKKVYLKYNNETPSIIRKHVEELLGESGFEVSKTTAVDYFLSLKYKTINEYINVKGFEKHSFELNLISQNNLKKQIGAFTISQTATGRNKQDAFLKVKKQMIDKLNEKLNLLNLK